ncbi:hypothetical protein J3F83DRAFT_755144 [Trichoderma novae-zelandiae]
MTNLTATRRIRTAGTDKQAERTVNYRIALDCIAGSADTFLDSCLASALVTSQAAMLLQVSNVFSRGLTSLGSEEREKTIVDPEPAVQVRGRENGGSTEGNLDKTLVAFGKNTDLFGIETSRLSGSGSGRLQERMKRKSCKSFPLGGTTRECYLTHPSWEGARGVKRIAAAGLVLTYGVPQSYQEAFQRPWPRAGSAKVPIVLQ